MDVNTMLKTMSVRIANRQLFYTRRVYWVATVDQWELRDIMQLRAVIGMAHPMRVWIDTTNCEVFLSYGTECHRLTANIRSIDIDVQDLFQIHELEW